MSFDDLQSAWQSQERSPPVSFDTELLLQEVQRNQRQLETKLFWRDTREIVVAAGLTVFFSYAGLKGGWTWYVLALACASVGGFLAGDRWLQRGRRPASEASLESCIQSSLLQVNHQIWLLKNVFWWYLLPIAIGWASVFVPIAWKLGPGEWVEMVCLAVYLLICACICWWVYWLNQQAVKRHLDPRRQELEGLLASLKQSS